MNLSDPFSILLAERVDGKRKDIRVKVNKVVKVNIDGFVKSLILRSP